MRAWLISAAVLVGCLHSPALPKDQRDSARKDWIAYMNRKEYVLAAETASRHKLDPRLVGTAFEHARNAAQDSLESYLKNRFKNATHLFAERMEKAFRVEIAIACAYGPTRAAGEMAVRDIEKLNESVSVPSLLFDLLVRDCPVGHDSRVSIILKAASMGMFDFALKHALRSKDWTADDALRLALLYAMARDCTRGLQVASVFSLKGDALTRLIAGSNCEEEAFATAMWAFPQVEARAAFFEAVRLRKYRLATAFNRLSGGGSQELAYLAREVFAKRDEYNLTDKMFLLSIDLRDAVYAHALAHGRARYVGGRAREIYWEERAFEQLIIEGKYEDAAETAQYGPSTSMKTEGVLRAFRAAVKAGDRDSFTYLWKRYDKIIPEKEYLDASAAWRPPSRKLPVKKLPPCPKDWGVKRSSCR